jgi:hypothetical protein
MRYLSFVNIAVPLVPVRHVYPLANLLIFADQALFVFRIVTGESLGCWLWSCQGRGYRRDRICSVMFLLDDCRRSHAHMA